MTYLYLLPFKDGVHFKLGISVSLEKRIKQHENNFDLDLDKALIVSANESVFILSLEKELLLMLEDSIYPSYYDGYTEVRFMKDFEKALNYIKSKDDFLGFQITDYNNPEFEIKQVKKRMHDRIKYTDKHMVVLTRIFKKIKLQRIEIANYLKITESEYYEIEKKGFDNNTKRKVIKFLYYKVNDIKYRRMQTDFYRDTLNILEELNRLENNC